MTNQLIRRAARDMLDAQIWCVAFLHSPCLPADMRDDIARHITICGMAIVAFDPRLALPQEIRVALLSPKTTRAQFIAAYLSHVESIIAALDPLAGDAEIATNYLVLFEEFAARLRAAQRPN